MLLFIAAERNHAAILACRAFLRLSMYRKMVPEEDPQYQFILLFLLGILCSVFEKAPKKAPITTFLAVSAKLFPAHIHNL